VTSTARGPAGGPTTTGRDEVRGACERTLADLESTRTTFSSWRTVVGDDAVVVDVVARYEGPQEAFAVASCDIYEFADGMVTAITSYVVELPTE
jgi:ketosteroid isomerase-like protein